MEKTTSLTLQDMVAVVNIIDTVSDRGAFKGAELSSVGTIRDKFASFVQENAPKEEEAAEAVEQEVEETSSDE